jgi:phosphate-selective porin
MLTTRYDAFEVGFMNDPSAPGSEDGHAWTFAYSWDPGDHWRFAAEWLRVTSDVKTRPVALGEPAIAIESKLEISARYVFNARF